MERLTITPFAGRRGRLAPQQPDTGENSVCSCGKWALFDELRMARAVFGVTDRDLTVLWAMLSFLPGPDLCAQAGLVVFPSNAALSDRTHGMAESTLRRHIAALVAAGLVARHDSPNGKRYARRGRDGAVGVAFGFDLSPLLLREAAIRQAAQAVRAAEEDAAAAREAAVLALRDLRALAGWVAEDAAPALRAQIAALSARLRRRMTPDAARALADEAQAVAAAQNSLCSGGNGGNAARNGRQHTESKDGFMDSDCVQNSYEDGDGTEDGGGGDPATVPLHLVVRACPDIALYAGAPIRRWRELCGAADRVRPMMGVSRDAWDEARGIMGDPQAAMVLAAILQKSTRVRSPGGYLRKLTRQAAQGRFRPGGMILTLLRDG